MAQPHYPQGRNPLLIVQVAAWAPGASLDGCGKSHSRRDSFPSPSSP